LRNLSSYLIRNVCFWEHSHLENVHISEFYIKEKSSILPILINKTHSPMKYTEGEGKFLIFVIK
jgi:hypothetical protein